MNSRYKYPRTPHLKWSPGRSADDVELASTEAFEGREVVVTVKLDGENTTLYRDYLHARSLDSSSHESQAWVRALQATVGHLIPEGWRIAGENLYAKHSIHYRNLDTYFYIYSIWDEKNRALSWDETEEWAALLGLQTVPVLYRGPWDETLIRNLVADTHDGDPCEGYVVRTAAGFDYPEFRTHVAKFVRAGHVTTDQHWKSQAVTPNLLRKK
jgi:hypothetical protein